MAIYPSIYDGPANNYSSTSAKKKYIAIHNTSNNATAENEASYAKRREDSVSSHYYVDNNSIIQSLDTKLKAWHAGSSEGNTYAISYEITGTNSKSRDWWLKNVAWDLLAKQIATDMKLWGIANQHLSVSEMKAGNKTGIITHDDMRRAWGGTTHTDPGGNFPMDHLLKKVAQYLGGSVGGVGEVEDMTPEEHDVLWDIKYMLWSGGRKEDGTRGDIREELYRIQRQNAAIAAKLDLDNVDENAVIQGVLAGLNPAAIAAAIPTDIAEQVVNELRSRLDS